MSLTYATLGAANSVITSAAELAPPALFCLHRTNRADFAAAKACPEDWTVVKGGVRLCRILLYFGLVETAMRMPSGDETIEVGVGAGDDNLDAPKFPDDESSPWTSSEGESSDESIPLRSLPETL